MVPRDLCRTEKQVCANDDDDDGCLRNSFVTWIPAAAGAREEIHRRARNKLEKVVSRALVVVVVVPFFVLEHNR